MTGIHFAAIKMSLPITGATPAKLTGRVVGSFSSSAWITYLGVGDRV